jgi:hypothetical protein
MRPLPDVVEGEWSWVAPVGAGWAASAIASAPLAPELSDERQRILEGWLRLSFGEPPRT